MKFPKGTKALLEEFLRYMDATFFKDLSEKAQAKILQAWDNEKGYNSAGRLVSWKRSEGSKRKNPIMTETGLLKSKISVTYDKVIDDLVFNIIDAAYPIVDKREARTTKEVSHYNAHFPHRGIPKEFRFGQSTAMRLFKKELKTNRYKTWLESLIPRGFIEL